MGKNTIAAIQQRGLGWKYPLRSGFVEQPDEQPARLRCALREFVAG